MRTESKEITQLPTQHQQLALTLSGIAIKRMYDALAYKLKNYNREYLNDPSDSELKEEDGLLEEIKDFLMKVSLFSFVQGNGSLYEKYFNEIHKKTFSSLGEELARKWNALGYRIKPLKQRNLETLRQYKFKKKPALLDTIGREIPGHLDSQPAKDRTATRIQTWWRHAYRARTLHRAQQLFGASSKNTLTQEIYLPQRFEYLHDEKIPSLQSSLQHRSSRLREILHDGIIYPRSISKKRGISEGNDTHRYDDRIISMSLPYQIQNKNYLIIKRSEITNSTSKSLYYKFFDWENKYSTPEIILADGCTMQIEVEFPQLSITIKRQNDKCHYKINASELIYHGTEGLEKFLTFLPFKIMNHIPDSHTALKELFYDFLSTLSPTQLIAHLQSITQQMTSTKNSEIAFLNPLTLSFKMLEHVDDDDVHVDFNMLRAIIARNDLDGLKSLTENDKARIILNNYFIIMGIYEYAHEKGAKIISNYIKTHFQWVFKEREEFQQREIKKQYAPPELIKHQPLGINLDSDINSIAEIIIEQYFHTDKIKLEHGAMHASRAAVYITMIIELYKSQNASSALALNDKDIKLLQIAALFHDLGRQSDTGDDRKEWERASAKKCFDFLLRLGVNRRKAEIIADAIVNKDSDINKPKSIYRKLIQNVDSLDVLRSPDWDFDATKMDYYKEFKSQIDSDKDAVQLFCAALDTAAILVYETCDLIKPYELQAHIGKLEPTWNHNQKLAYEKSRHCFTKIAKHFSEVYHMYFNRTKEHIQKNKPSIAHVTAEQKKTTQAETYKGSFWSNRQSSDKIDNNQPTAQFQL